MLSVHRVSNWSNISRPVAVGPYPSLVQGSAITANATRSELRTRFDDLTLLGTMPLVLRARLAWAHDWVSNPTLGAVFEPLPGSNFTVNGAAPPKNYALTSTGAELHTNDNWSLAEKSDGEFVHRKGGRGGSTPETRRADQVLSRG